MARPLISADNHVFEPVTLWQERLPVEFRERGPRVEQRDDWIVMAIEGMPERKLTKANGNGGGSGGSLGSGATAGGADPDQRLRDMASDGVVAEVIYPTFGLFIDMIPAPDLAMACAQVYNDWLAESFLHRPDVFIPAAVVPVRDVPTAVAEMERVASLGFKAAMIPTSPPEGLPYNRPDYDPLWQIAADARHAVVVAHRHRRAAATRARARRRGDQLREGRTAFRRDALLLHARRVRSNGSPSSGWCSSRPAPVGTRTAASAWTKRSRNTSNG